MYRARLDGVPTCGTQDRRATARPTDHTLNSPPTVSGFRLPRQGGGNGTIGR